MTRVLIAEDSPTQAQELELVLAEPQEQGRFSVIEVDGLPVLQQGDDSDVAHRRWPGEPVLLPLDPPATAGEDCLKLRLRVDDQAQLQVEITDLPIPGRTVLVARLATRPLAEEDLELAVTGWNLLALADGGSFQEHPLGQNVGARWFGSATWRF